MLRMNSLFRIFALATCCLVSSSAPSWAFVHVNPLLRSREFASGPRAVRDGAAHLQCTKEAPKDRRGLSRQDFLLATIAASVPAFFASALAGSEAPPNSAGQNLAITYDTEPTQEFLEKKGVDKWKVFESEKRKFAYTFNLTESVYVTDGEATITPQGLFKESVPLKPGTFATFPRGTKVNWDVEKKLQLRFKEYKAILNFE